MCSLDSTRGTWIGSFATVVIAPAGPTEAPDVSDMVWAERPSQPYISSALNESFAYSASKNNFLKLQIGRENAEQVVLILQGATGPSCLLNRA